MDVFQMRKIFNLFIASLLTVSLGVATVVCCCIAPSVMAHIHKTAMCSHCPDQGSQSHPVNPAGACQQQLTSAELLHSQTISFDHVLGKLFQAPIFFDNHITTIPPPTSLAYPPGSPPSGISFTPLYLRTFNLRI